METVLFGFVKEYGVTVSIFVLAALVLYRVAPDWAKARIQNEKALSLALIEKERVIAEALRCMQEGALVTIPLAIADLNKTLAVESVLTNKAIEVMALEIKTYILREFDAYVKLEVARSVDVAMRNYRDCPKCPTDPK